MNVYVIWCNHLVVCWLLYLLIIIWRINPNTWCTNTTSGNEDNNGNVMWTVEYVFWQPWWLGGVCQAVRELFCREWYNHSWQQKRNLIKLLQNGSVQNNVKYCCTNEANWYSLQWFDSKSKGPLCPEAFSNSSAVQIQQLYTHSGRVSGIVHFTFTCSNAILLICSGISWSVESPTNSYKDNCWQSQIRRLLKHWRLHRLLNPQCRMPAIFKMDQSSRYQWMYYKRAQHQSSVIGVKETTKPAVVVLKNPFAIIARKRDILPRHADTI